MNETQILKINELLDNASFLITHFKSVKDDVNAIKDEHIKELRTSIDSVILDIQTALAQNKELISTDIASKLENALNELSAFSANATNELNTIVANINASALAIKFKEPNPPKNIPNAQKGDTFLNTSSGSIYVCLFSDENKQVWSSNEDYVDDELNYPKVGDFGFGVALRHKSARQIGLSPMNDCENIISRNFGNYVDKNNNIFVCVPKMYYKIDNSFTIPELNYQPKVEVSYEPKDGFSPFLCFVKSDGSLVDELFISKYAMSNSMGVNIYGGHGASIFGGVPVGSPSGATAHNSPNYLRANAKYPVNNNGGLFDAVKTNGDEYCVAHASIYFMLAIVGMANAQAVYPRNIHMQKLLCAYIDKEPFYPKGNYQNTLKCSFDDEILYSNLDSYANKARSGAVKGFAKTTHNGQECGIADLAGNMWELGAGFMATTNGVFILKGIDYLEKLNPSNIYDESLYNQIDITGRNKNGNFFAGDGAVHLFTAKTDTESKNDYICDNLLQVKDNTTSATGTDVYAKNYINTYMVNQHLPLYGGHWNEGGSKAGVFTRAYTTASGSALQFGCRMMLVPKK